jgi:drug/metabolite transporter (DMT)-like permease
MKQFFRIYDHPYLLLVLAVLFWAGNFIVAKLVPEGIAPIGLAFWRWFGAAILILPIAIPQLKKDRKEIISKFLGQNNAQDLFI